MYCAIKKKFYYVHRLYDKTWLRPAAFSPKNTGAEDDDKDSIVDSDGVDNGVGDRVRRSAADTLL